MTGGKEKSACDIEHHSEINSESKGNQHITDQINEIHA